MEIGNEVFFDQQKLLLSSCSRVTLYNHIHSGICDIIWMSSIVHILIILYMVMLVYPQLRNGAWKRLLELAKMT